MVFHMISVVFLCDINNRQRNPKGQSRIVKETRRGNQESSKKPEGAIKNGQKTRETLGTKIQNEDKQNKNKIKTQYKKLKRCETRTQPLNRNEHMCSRMVSSSLGTETQNEGKQNKNTIEKTKR